MAIVPPAVGSQVDVNTIGLGVTSAGVASSEKRTRGAKRCRECGHDVKGGDFQSHHQCTFSGMINCSVPPNQRLPKYPLDDRAHHKRKAPPASTPATPPVPTKKQRRARRCRECGHDERGVRYKHTWIRDTGDARNTGGVPFDGEMACACPAGKRLQGFPALRGLQPSGRQKPLPRARCDDPACCAGT